MWQTCDYPKIDPNTFFHQSEAKESANISPENEGSIDTVWFEACPGTMDFKHLFIHVLYRYEEKYQLSTLI